MYLIEVPHVPSFFPLKKKPNKYDLVSRSFDESLLRRLKALTPPPSSPSISISLSWLSLAVDFLSFVNSEAATLISNLKLSSSSSVDDSLAFYLDHSVKVLDLCSSISSEIERLRHRRLRLNFFLHLLTNSPNPEKLQRARDSLSDWESDSAASFKVKRAGLETSVEDLMEDLALRLGNSPRGKFSGAGKLVRRTIHAFGLVTVFVAGVVVATLRGSPELVASVRAEDEFAWADSFHGLQSAISAELTRRFGGERKDGNDKSILTLKELDDVERRVREVCEVIDDVSKEEKDKNKEGSSNEAVEELERAKEAFSGGLDRLSNGVNGLFKTVLSTRKGILEKLRVGPEKVQ